MSASEAIVFFISVQFVTYRRKKIANFPISIFRHTKAEVSMIAQMVYNKFPNLYLIPSVNFSPTWL